MLEFSATYPHPLAIRYPRSGKVLLPEDNTPIEVGKWSYVHKTGDTDSKITVLATGERSIVVAMKVLQKLQKSGKSFDIVNARFVKPLDKEWLEKTQSKYIVTIEDNVALGGFGSMVSCAIQDLSKDVVVKTFAYRDAFIPQGKIADLQAEFGVNCAEIEAYITSIL